MRPTVRAVQQTHFGVSVLLQTPDKAVGVRVLEGQRKAHYGIRTAHKWEWPSWTDHRIRDQLKQRA